VRIQSMAARGSCRDFLETPIPMPVLEMLCATALSAPTKSDLQQRDIIVVQSPDARRAIAGVVGDQPWVFRAPALLMFCGNNRRQRLLHDWKGIAFANDHLDAFFNAVADASIALGAFVTAAESIGLGCCPISAVRNDARAVSDILALPDHVFPVAGLAVGYPNGAPQISKRLPLSHTVHVDKYQEEGLRDVVKTYDHDRAAAQPYGTQRYVDLFGESENYAWSDDKVRQYSQPERQGFGAFVRTKGFCLD